MDRLSLEARKQLIELLLRQSKEIKEIYIGSVDSIADEIKKRELEGTAYQYIEMIDDHLRNEALTVEDKLIKLFDEGLKISVEAGMHQSKQATLSFLKKAHIDWKPIERAYFRANTAVVEKMKQRTIKGLNLSDRIWEKSQQVRISIGQIVQQAIAEGEHPVKVAELLERYVRDGANTFVVEYPNMMERMPLKMDLSYESLRLARTEMAAAFGEGVKEGAELNPSNLGIQWGLSNAGNACDVCKQNAANDEDGLGPGVYKVENLPDYPAHPNCLCYLSEVLEDTDAFVDRLIEWNRDPSSQPDIEQWYQKEIKSTNHISYQSINWTQELSVSQTTSNELNYHHQQLNEFMKTNKREKAVLLNVDDGKVLFEQEGHSEDQVILNKEFIKLLKNSPPKSIIFAHNHPSTTTFSSSDIDKIIRYPSVRALTLECIDGSKYLIDGKNYSHSWKAFFFGSKYDKIYNNIAKKYPQLNDSSIYDVWDQFVHEVTQEISKEYNLIYKKVN
ncbi:MAG TPA: hypothetical protein DEO65_04460 [Bacillus bacterium]|uniref:hypothetical protein n=1 Tax=Siminovitchia fordii TaxID=254759 RepID=UPI00035EEDB8|nr:hypothetical protein [Siminovitchia fordii]HBZ09128.1 hypothetical protein [Bacillus sp. (in: firmicutes)]